MHVSMLVLLIALCGGCDGGGSAGPGGSGDSGGSGDLAGVVGDLAGVVGDLAGGQLFDGGAGGGDLATSSDVIDKLLALTAKCTAAEMVSAHTYPDPDSDVHDVPICALKGALFFN